MTSVVEALTLWINPAEWMYCSTGRGMHRAGGWGRSEKRDDINETGVNSAISAIVPV